MAQPHEPATRTGICAPVSEVGVAGGGAGVSIRAPLSAYGRKWKKTTQPNGDRMEAPKSDTRVPTTGTTVQLYILATQTDPAFIQAEAVSAWKRIVCVLCSHRFCACCFRFDGNEIKRSNMLRYSMFTQRQKHILYQQEGQPFKCSA
eukprot:COSAG05_NODE_70_length_22091_cov_108.202164_16_plen_147_part_00